MELRGCMTVQAEVSVRLFTAQDYRLPTRHLQNPADMPSRSLVLRFHLLMTFKGGMMRFGPFMIIAFLLLILWAGGFLMFHVASGLIHLLLLFAVISFVMHLVMGSRTA